MSEPLEVVSFDLDSTTYNTRHRHYLIDRVNGTDWDYYSMQSIDDTPGPAWHLARLLTKFGIPFIIVSGRSECAREVTLAKLEEDEIRPLHVFMCDERHNTMDHGAWKALRIKEVQDEYNLKVLFHVEDITAVAIACEALGVPTMLVHDIESGHPDHLG